MLSVEATFGEVPNNNVRTPQLHVGQHKRKSINSLDDDPGFRNEDGHEWIVRESMTFYGETSDLDDLFVCNHVIIRRERQELSELLGWILPQRETTGASGGRTYDR